MSWLERSPGERGAGFSVRSGGTRLSHQHAGDWRRIRGDDWASRRTREFTVWIVSYSGRRRQVLVCTGSRNDICLYRLGPGALSLPEKWEIRKRCPARPVSLALRPASLTSALDWSEQDRVEAPTIGAACQ